MIVLQREIEEVLEFGKDREKKLPYKYFRLTFAQAMFEIKYKRSPQGAEEREAAAKLLDEIYAPRVELLSRVPKGIFDEDEDLQAVLLGYIRKKSKARLRKYYKKTYGKKPPKKCELE